MNTTIAEVYQNCVQRTRGWRDVSVLTQLKKNQWLPHEIIQRQRLELLLKILRYSEVHVPYYRSLWKSIGFSPEDVKKESDIIGLPIISKDTLRENYDSILSEVDPHHDIWKSSGSTGMPFPFRLDKMTIIYNTFGSLSRGRSWWGFDYGQPEGMIWSGLSDVSGTWRGRLETLKRRLSWSLKNIKLIDVYGLDQSTIADGYFAFLKHQPIVLRAISSGLYRFCAGIDQLGLDGTKIGVKGAIYTGEGLSDPQRKLIERVLGCKTICEYGCTELGVIGFECPEGSIHLSHDNLIIEFLKNGYPAQAGEIAELVITNLRSYASPLIRYAVGDFVVPSNKVCECGRTLPIIESVQGRIHDSVITPDGKIINGLFFTHLFDKHDEIHQFRVVQENLENIHIELVALENIKDSIINDIRKVVENKFGPQVKVSVNQVSSLPLLSSGKTPWIISNASS